MSSEEVPNEAAAAAEVVDEKKESEETAMTEEDPASSPKKRSAEDHEAAAEDTTEEKPTPTPSSFNSRSKRARKSTSQYVPADFSQVDRSASVIDGLGVKLETIPAIRQYVDNLKKLHAADLYECYKLLFHGKTKPSFDDLKARILQFNGFIPKDADKPEQAQAKEKMQERMWKFQVAALRRICNTLQLDRSGKTSKEDLMELLGEFLAKPQVKYTKKGGANNNSSSVVSKKKKSTPTPSSSSKKKTAVSAKKTKAKAYTPAKKTTTTKKSTSKKTMSFPSDDALEEWVQAYVIVFDTSQVGMRHAWEILQAKFGFDATIMPAAKTKAYKAQVKQQLMQALEEREANMSKTTKNENGGDEAVEEEKEEESANTKEETTEAEAMDIEAKTEVNEDEEGPADESNDKDGGESAEQEEATASNDDSEEVEATGEDDAPKDTADPEEEAGEE